MEVSYYIECQSNSEKYYATACLTADQRSALFTFKIDANYEDTNINESNELWTRIEPLLKKSFGRIEMILSEEHIKTIPVQKRRRNERSSTKIEKESVKIQVKMHPVRNSAKDLEKLLADDKTACLKFLSFNSIAKSGDSCWNENTKSIFKEKGIEFLGVNFRVENNPSNDKFASPIKSTTKNEATKTSTITTLAIMSTKTISTIFSTTTTSTTLPSTKPSTSIPLTILTPLSNAPIKPSTTTTHPSVISKPVNGLILKETTSSSLSSSYSWCYSWCKSMNYTKCQLSVYTDFRQCEWNGG